MELQLHSFANAEGREYLSENLVGRRLARNLTEITQGIVQTYENDFFARSRVERIFRLLDRIARAH